MLCFGGDLRERGECAQWETSRLVLRLSAEAKLPGVADGPADSPAMECLRVAPLGQGMDECHVLGDKPPTQME